MNRMAVKNPPQPAPARILTPAEAASIVFNVSAPSVEQIGRIVARINAGVIRRSEKGGMTTTPEAIAEFLSKLQVARKKQGNEKPTKSQETQETTVVTAVSRRVDQQRQEVNREMTSCYRDFMRDYFKALLCQRISGQLSAFLRTFVLVSQIVVLASILLFAVFFVKGVGALIGPTARDKAATAWLKEHFTNAELEKLSAEPNQVDTMRAKFTYVPEMRRNTVHHEILFRFQGDQLVKAFGDGDEDE